MQNQTSIMILHCITTHYLFHVADYTWKVSSPNENAVSRYGMAIDASSAIWNEKKEVHSCEINSNF